MATSPPPPPPSTTPNPNGETTVFAPIKLICQRRKKRTKHEMFLNFVDYRTVNSAEESPCLEILDQSAIQFDDCISVEYFDAIKTIYQSFISLYYPSLTISIYFSDEHFPKKEIVVKHLKSIFQSNDDQSEEIFHSFDAKLIPCPPIIPREHPLIGRIRLFFTMTDLYISSIGTSLNELKMTMNNPNSVKEKSIISIPYFTIKHYGNRGRIFLVELGKSKYGDGELRMKCLTSTLASTIHLFASPVIEERPWVLSSAFANQFITDKRREKSKHIHPPIPFHHDVSKGPIIDLSLPFLEKPTEEPTPVPPVKSRSFVHTFRKFVKHVSPLQRSVTLDQVPPSSSARPSLNSLPDPLVFPPPTPINVSIQRTEPEMKLGSYVDMGPATKEINEKIETIEEEKEEEEEKRKVDVGVNTIISISPQVRSVIIVGNSVHLISEEKEIYPIGQRSFTSPASVLQPFRSQLRGQVSVNNYAMPPDLNSCAPMSSSSFYQPSSTITSQQNVFVTYDILTFDPPVKSDNALDEQSLTIDSTEKMLSPSSSASYLIPTMSLSTNPIADHLSGSILTSDRSIILLNDQSPTYLFDAPSKSVNPMAIANPENLLESSTILSSDVNQSNSEEERPKLPASVMIVYTDLDNDPNRTPPFVL